MTSAVRGSPAIQSDQAFLQRVGGRVRAARTRLGMSRKALAEASGVSERYLAQLETGSGNISILLLRQVADATATPVEDLVGEPDADAETLTLMAAVRSGTAEERRRLLAALEELRHSGGADPRAGRVALIGLRGAGKSTLGRMAAERLGLPFVELNREIEAESGLSIPEVFSLYGEQGYRRLENRCLRLVAARHRRVVLAVAGGIVGERETYDALLRDFHTVWLRADPEEHMARVRAQGDNRPMAGNPRALDELRALLDARDRLYSHAEAELHTSGRTVDESCRDLCALVTRLQDGGEAP